MKCGLLGEHLGHSYSPQLHALLGDYDYKLFEVAPENLENFLKTGDFDGINVTIPYKKSVIPYCSQLSPIARRLGSVNMVLRQPDGSLYGDNTDYAGFSWLLKRNGGIEQGKKALIFGTGGAAVTAKAVLEEQGARVVLLSRRGENTYENLDAHADAVLAVNATPVGMYPNNGERLVDLDKLPNLRCVLDLIYNPARTSLLMDAEERGLQWENGLAMLVAQAKRACELFTGTAIPNEKCEQILCKLRKTTDNIILIGMPSCGKTTVGRELASRLNRPFYDTDELLVEQFGCDISAFFRAHGENAFRAAETKLLESLGKSRGGVIATGGGCVTRGENYPLLHQNGTIVYLERGLEKLQVEGRPLSQMCGLKQLFAERTGVYERFADVVIDNNSCIDDAVEKILCKLF